MSEPFIKVWASDMRADPKIALLQRRDPLAPYLLIQMWDLAKNGPVYGELRNDDGTPMRASDFADLIPGVVTKQAAKLFELLTSGDENRALAVRADDGALCFPKLERRQGNRRLNGVPSELSELRAAAGAKGARARWAAGEHGKPDSKPDGKPDSKTPSKTDGKTGLRDGKHGKPDGKTLRASSREPEPDKPLSLEGQSPATPTSDTARDPDITPTRELVGQALPRTDQIQIKAPDLASDVRHEVERLLAVLADRDDGTPGVLVNLARHGAQVRHFADARQAVIATSPTHPSRYACRVITTALELDRSPSVDPDDVAI